MIETTMQMEQADLMIAIFGAFDENIKLIERELGVSVVSRATELKISGDPEAVGVAERVFAALLEMARRGEAVSTQTVQYVIGLAREGRESEVHTMGRDVLVITAKGKPIKAKTLGQKKYMEAIRTHTITMGIGPAGTGKTYLAVAAAVAAFRDKQVSRIILTRPAVEAGEKLGFLPGDLQSKVDPYLRPLYDGLFDMMGAENFQKHMEKGSIEVAPLAYMRERCDSGRGAEHHARADEDVPDPYRLWFQGGHHGRRDPDRPARRQDLGTQGSIPRAHGCARHRAVLPDRQGRRASRAGTAHCQGVRRL